MLFRSGDQCRRRTPGDGPRLECLGSKYVVRSSVGHIRDLPRSRMAIDIEHDFAPEYILVKGKAAIKNELTAMARSASNVLLASDPDREGEAIAWHLAELLGLDLSEKCRVRFYEITANATIFISFSVKHFRIICISAFLISSTSKIGRAHV